MRTQTRARMLELIGNAHKPLSVSEIARSLKITVQAAYKHLRLLVKSGRVHTAGQGRATRYSLKESSPARDVLRLDAARAWHSAKTPPKDTGGLLCGTSEELFRRFELTAEIVARLVSKTELTALLGVMAHLSGNAFDHNDGHWHDMPGCWLETQLVGKQLWICVADRGQGVFRSLRRAHPEIPDEQAALAAAFERTISGNGRKGEGLKKVRAAVMKGDRGIACRSGRGASEGFVHYGRLGSQCRAELARLPASPYGTIALVAWATAG